MSVLQSISARLRRRVVVAGICFLSLLNFSTYPAVADPTPEDWARCNETPECVAWFDGLAALDAWFDAVSLNAWYLALDRARNPCDDDWPIPAYIVQRESGCTWTARNPKCPPCAGGFAQMIQSTANNAARDIGHPELVDVNAAQWPPHLQEEAVNLLATRDGLGHWALTR